MIAPGGGFHISFANGVGRMRTGIVITGLGGEQGKMSLPAPVDPVKLNPRIGDGLTAVIVGDVSISPYGAGRAARCRGGSRCGRWSRGGRRCRRGCRRLRGRRRRRGSLFRSRSGKNQTADKSITLVLQATAGKIRLIRIFGGEITRSGLTGYIDPVVRSQSNTVPPIFARPSQIG